MGCGPSALNPMAGRNAVTQAASERKKAAKVVLDADKAYAASTATYLDSMRACGTSLGTFLEEEDKALYGGNLGAGDGAQPLRLEYNKPAELTNGGAPASSKTAAQPQAPAPNMVYSQETKQWLNMNDKMNNGWHGAQEPVLQQKQPMDSPPVSPTAPPKPPPEFGMPRDDASASSNQAAGGAPGAPGAPGGGWSADGTTFKFTGSFAEHASEAWQGKTEGKPLEASAAQQHLQPPNVLPPQMPLGPRGAGLSYLWKTLNSLFLEAIEAARPVTEQVSVGLAKSYAALPPLPPYVTGQQGLYPGQKPPTQETLWAVLEILVAYEKHRSKQTKAMELAKYDHGRSSRHLNKAASRAVTVEKASKQQAKINAAHQKVQSHQAKIAMLSQNIEEVTRLIENIKNMMLLPALQRLLPIMAHSHMRMAAIHDRQRQVVLQVIGAEGLQSKIVQGPGVLFTTKAHSTDTKGLETAFGKWNAAFSAKLAAEKKLFNMIIVYLRKCNPHASVNLASTQTTPLPLPGAGPAPQASLPAPPQGGAGGPVVTLPPDTPPQNQIVPVQPQQGMVLYQPPPQQLLGQFLDGHTSIGEPLLALCQDWVRAMDKLPELAVKDAVLAYVGWLKETVDKQMTEFAQLKKLEALKLQTDKAQHKYEGLLKKERDYRATMVHPYEGPMSRSLSTAINSKEEKIASSTPLPMLMAPPGAEVGAEGPASPGAGGPPSGPLDPSQSALQQNTPPPHTPLAPTGTDESPLDKESAKAFKAEQAKEVKAFQIAKEVDLAKGLWEGLKLKCLEETGSLQVMAYESHLAAVTGLAKSLPGVFLAEAGFSTILSQMYAMLQFQHARQ